MKSSSSCEIIVYHLDHLKMVYEVAVTQEKNLQIATPYAAVAFAGGDYFLNMQKRISQDYPGCVIPFFIDCGPYPGYVMAALRSGAKYLYVESRDDALKSMAQKSGAILLTGHDKPPLQVDMVKIPKAMNLTEWIKDLSNHTGSHSHSVAF